MVTKTDNGYIDVHRHFANSPVTKTYITSVSTVAWVFAFEREAGHLVRARRTHVEVGYGPDGYYVTSASYPHTSNHKR